MHMNHLRLPSISPCPEATRRRRRFSYLGLTLLIVVGFWSAWIVPAAGQDASERGHSSPANGAAMATGRQSEAVDAASQPRRDAEPPESNTMPATSGLDRSEASTATAGTDRLAPRDPATLYGLWVLVPALTAIVLAIVFRQVIPSLVLGILVAAYLMVPCQPADGPYAGQGAILAGLRMAAEQYAVGAITDPTLSYGHVKIIVFTLVIGFTVGVIGRNGGTEGMVQLVTGSTRSRRRGALTAWLAGLVVFFDDYANTMIVGPTMRSVFDRLKLSRAKLAYIVDSTAAPVASIALIGTWVGTEVSLIGNGLAKFTPETAPAFLMLGDGRSIDGMTAFLHSLAYRYYPILALFLVFVIAVTGRDFGPMKQAERKALSAIDPDPPTSDAAAQAEAEAKSRRRWWLGLVPILALIVVTIWVLVASGYHGMQDDSALQGSKPLWERASQIVSAGDAYLSIFYGAIASAFLAVILTAVVRACSMKDAVDAGLDGMARMFPAIVILVLAWALSAALQDLKLGEIVAGHLERAEFPARWLPLSVFVCAALISFATGTSWGTMGILCPVTVEISARLLADMDTSHAVTLFYASVGSVLSGAVFGDHCSPISDTTVLSSIASDCRHEEHVWTQIPYALLAAVAAMGLGDVLCSGYEHPWYLGLGAGALLIVVWMFVVGRRPVPSLALAKHGTP